MTRQIPMKSIASLAIITALSAVSAEAALIVQYRPTTNGNFTTRSVVAADYHDDIAEPTHFEGHGGAIFSHFSGSDAPIGGYGTAIDLTRYAGFKLSVDPGDQLTLDNLQFVTRGTGLTPNASYQWGYRLDLNNDGAFSGTGEQWILGKLYTSADTNFSSLTAKTWDLTGVTVTGTVEFGLFWANPDGNTENNQQAYQRNVTLNGTITAIPEPSSMLLGAFAGLGLLRRRR